MKTWSEHIAALTDVIVAARRDGSDDREAVRDYLLSAGFERGSINASIIADKAWAAADRITAHRAPQEG